MKFSERNPHFHRVRQRAVSDGWRQCRLNSAPLVEIHSTLQSLGLAEHLNKAIRWRLTQILGSPFAQPAKPKKLPRRMEKPAEISQVTWSEMLTLR